MTAMVNRSVSGLAYLYCDLLYQRKIFGITRAPSGSYDEYIERDPSKIPFLSGLLAFTAKLTFDETRKLIADLAELAEKPNALADIVFAANAMKLTQAELELKYIEKLTTVGAEYTLDSIIQTPLDQTQPTEFMKSLETFHASEHVKHMLRLASELGITEPVDRLKKVYRGELPELTGHECLHEIAVALDGAKLPGDVLRGIMLESLRAADMTHHEIQHTLGLLFTAEASAEKPSSGLVDMPKVWPGDARFDPNQQNEILERWKQSVADPAYAEAVSEWQRAAIDGHQRQRSQTRSLNLSIKHTAECKKRLAKKKMRKQTRKASKK